MLKGMDAREYALYKARAGIYPFPHEIVQRQIAFLHSTLLNIFSKPESTTEVKELVFDYRENYKEHLKKESEEFTQDQIDKAIDATEIAILSAFAATGAKINVIKPTSSNDHS